MKTINRFALASATAMAAVGTAAVAASPLFKAPGLVHFLKAHATDGATVEQDETDPRTITFTIPDKAKARAEIRRESQKEGLQKMGGVFVLHGEEGNYLSIIQALNVRAPDEPTGSSEPMAQLAIRKNGETAMVDGQRKAVYEFYIEQAHGKPTCEKLGKFTAGQKVRIEMLYTKGAWPLFARDSDKTKTCTGGKLERIGGDPSNASTRSYYYGKLGVYKTTDGTGSASVTWSEIFD